MATFGWQRFPQMNSDSYPGIGRLGYFGAQVIFLIGGIALAIAMPKAYLTDPVSASLFFFAGVIGFALHIMRLHNAGASGWIALGLLIPFGGLLVPSPAGTQSRNHTRRAPRSWPRQPLRLRRSWAYASYDFSSAAGYR